MWVESNDYPSLPPALPPAFGPDEVDGVVGLAAHKAEGVRDLEGGQEPRNVIGVQGGEPQPVFFGICW